MRLRFSLIISLMLLSGTTNFADESAAETIGLKRAYGDDAGCYFLKTGTVKTDSGTFIDKERVWNYEGGCSFSNVKNITKEFSISTLRNAWNVKMICQSEGEIYSYDAIITHNVEHDGLENVEIIPEGTISDGSGTERLYPCR